MCRARLVAILLAGALVMPACGAGSGDHPRLVVLIGIDQFRADYLQKYDAMFTGGFRRLNDEGWCFERGLVDHAPTLSLPGHTTLATGAHPRNHGVASNSWIETTREGERRRITATIDPLVEIVGHPDSPGASPRYVRATSLADWFREADPEARTVALSTGPALAVLYGGRAQEDRSRNHVYWLGSNDGEFVTSSYYRDDYPDWMNWFNREEMPSFRSSLIWDNSVPGEHRHLARPDDTPYEWDRVHTVFPHSPADLSDDVTPRLQNRWYFDSPLANEALFALASRAVESLSLGQTESTDLLSIAVKSVDRAGHDFGPNSQEQLDNLYRLDLDLGRFFETLDEKVGRDNYIVVVSADHGAPNVTEYEVAQGRPARRVSEDEFRVLLAGIETLVEAHDGDAGDLPGLIAAELEKADFIARAMTPGQLEGKGAADGILAAYRNAYDPEKPNMYPLWTMDLIRGNIGPAHPALFGVMVELEYQTNIFTAASTHGSAHDYDRNVPIVFMGKGIPAGRSRGPARTVDVAPTAAYLAGVPFPPSVDGSLLLFEEDISR